MGVFRSYHKTINSKFYEEDQKLFEYYQPKEKQKGLT